MVAIISLIVVCIILVLFVVYSCLRASANADKYATISYKEYKKKKNRTDCCKDLFCLAMNKPAASLDFSKMKGCEPEKCVFCKMSTFIDLE